MNHALAHQSASTKEWDNELAHQSLGEFRSPPSWFLGVSEWTIGTLLFLGFWDKRAGILGALGSTATFIATVTIIPFMPDGWDQSAGGFPAMTGNVPFLMKDVVLLAASLYLLKQDVMRVSLGD